MTRTLFRPRALCLATVLAATTAAFAQQSTPATRTNAAPTVALLEDARIKYKVPALGAVVVRAEHVQELAVAGVRHDGRPDSVQPSDRFHIGSNGKAMTATLLAVLVEQGMLKWDSKPGDIFPEWKGQILPDYENITVVDLLTHRAGVPPYTDTDEREFKQLKGISGTPMEQRSRFALWVLSHKPTVKPGTERVYSNGGYAIAGAIAERVTGESWESLMRTRVFDPLGIHVTIGWPAASDPQQPWGHYETRNGVRPHDPNDAYKLPDFLKPAGDISINLEDYAKFIQLHLRGLAGHDGLLKAETVKRLHTPVDEIMALGWGIQQFEGALASAHNGSGGTFFSVVVIWPSRDLAIVVNANSAETRSRAACVEVLKELARRAAAN